MSKINKYACKEEIEEFLDELKLENHVRQHGEIKAFVLEYMLKNPPGKGCVVQVGTFGKTTRSDTHGQNAHGLIISYVCPRLIPLAGDQLMQKRIGGHHVCCRYDGSTKQYVIQIQFNQSNEITDAPINAAKENMTDMFYHTDEYVTENEIDNFLDGLQIERLVKEHQYVSHAIRSILLDYMPVPNRSMQVTTIGKPPATSDNHETKEFGFYIRYQAQKTPAGDNNHPTSIRVGGHHIHGSYNPSIKEFVISVRFNNYNKFQDNSENVRTSILKSREEAAQPQKEIKMNLEQIATELTEMGVTDFWGSMFMHLANEAGYSGDHDVKFEKLSDSIAVSFGECQGEMDTQRVVIEALNQDLSINTYTDGAVFLVPVTVTTLKKPTQQTKTQKEAEMYIPKTTIQILKPIYRDRLEKAGLSEEAIRVILDEVFHGKALKAPKEDSSFVILSGKDVLHIYYSHNNKAIGMANIEATKSTQAGDVIDYSVGIEDATFIVDTSNTQEKLIHRHLGVPKLKLSFSDGSEIDVPFDIKRDYVGKEGVIVTVSCLAYLRLQHKKLHHESSPAVIDATERQAPKYFLNGVEHTEEEFKRRTVPGASTWSDIE